MAGGGPQEPALAAAPLVEAGGPATKKAALQVLPDDSGMASCTGASQEFIPSEEPRRRDSSECLNILLLGALYTLYLGYRSGCVVVLPLVSKELLRQELDDAEFSPLYQVPFATWFVMDIFIAAPSAFLLQRCGPRRGFLVAAVASIVGSSLAFLVLRFCRRPWLAYALLIFSVMVMSLNGVLEFVRYTASDVCLDPRRKSRAVSLVLSGGATLSMVGPYGASVASSLSSSGAPIAGYADFFLVTLGFSLLALVVAAALHIPPPPSCAASMDDSGVEAVLRAEPAVAPEAEATLRQIMLRPTVASAMLAQVAVQFSMLAPISAVPLRMQSHLPRMHAADVRISSCIVLHEFCMFAPGLCTGDLIKRCGTLPVMAAGLVLQACCMVTSLLSSSLWDYYLGMALLGVGWNFAFVGSTMLLLESHSPAERTKVTSANETIRFTANGVAVLAAAAIPWGRMSVLCLVLLALVALALCSRSSRRQ